MSLYQITHLAFKTGVLMHVTDIVEAEDRNTALRLYNQLARSSTYSAYPYGWVPVEANRVTDLEVLDLRLMAIEEATR